MYMQNKHPYSLAIFKNQTKPNIVVDHANDIKCVSESMIRSEIFLPNSVIALLLTVYSNHTGGGTKQIGIPCHAKRGGKIFTVIRRA